MSSLRLCRFGARLYPCSLPSWLASRCEAQK
jgi:hypothetical protein